MDAMLYPPAAAYVRPVEIPGPLSTADTSIARLLSNPATKAILLGIMPDFEKRVALGQMKPHLDNFSPRSLVQFGLFKADELDRVDVALRAMAPAAAR